MRRAAAAEVTRAERRPRPKKLVYLLVRLDKQYAQEQPAEPWETYYAHRIIDHFH